ncbi:hypothetical protein V5O48_003713 [Marasmius crinis-equi]|uniref:Uncharacterized protein n=1 Tax=Marasmius crinis-equi TaxID=585013 RepID=A0ABR3FS48_9AGAR
MTEKPDVKMAELGIPVDDVTNALARYPNFMSALLSLRKLGSPPLGVDHSGGTDKAALVCAILLSLAAQVKERQLKTHLIAMHWLSVFGRWTEFVLRNVILAQERPDNEAALENFERSVASLGVLLRFSEEDTVLVKGASPHLQSLAVQAWYLLLNLGHPIWQTWSAMLWDLRRTDTGPPLPSHSTVLVPYRNDIERGQILIKHLNLLINDITSRRTKEFDALHMFLMQLTTTKTQTALEHNPMLSSPDVALALRAMTQLVTILLLTKRGSIREETVDKNAYCTAHDLVLMALDFIIRSIHRQSQIRQVLEDDILTSIMHTNPRYFAFDESDHAQPVQKISHFSSMVINQIATFLVYPTVLRQFIRSSRKVEVNVDSITEMGARELTTAWENAIGKASSLHKFHQKVRKGETLCSNDAIPKRATRLDIYDALAVSQ